MKNKKPINEIDISDDLLKACDGNLDQAISIKNQALKAAATNGNSLKWFSDAIKDDKEIVMIAIREGKAGSYSIMSKRLSKDPDIIIEQSTLPLSERTLSLYNLGLDIDARISVQKDGFSILKDLQDKLKCKNVDFFRKAICLLDDDGYFPKMVETNLNAPKGMEYFTEEMQSLYYVKELLPYELLTMKVRSEGIKKILNEEFERRNLLAIKQDIQPLSKGKEIHRRTTLLP